MKEELIMANVKEVRQPSPTLELGGKVRTFAYDLNAFAEMEEKYGSIEKGLAAMDKGSMIAMRFMIYLGLKHEDPNLTEEEVGNLVTMETLPEISEAMAAAIKVNLPQKQHKSTKSRAKK